MNEIDKYISTLSGKSKDAAIYVAKKGGDLSTIKNTLNHYQLIPGQTTNVEKDDNININSPKDEKSLWEKTKDNWNHFVNESFESAGATRRGEQTIVENVGQQFGNTASLLVDEGMSVLGSIYDFAGSPLKEEAEKGLEAIANTSVGKLGLEALGKGMEEWNSFSKENPRVARDVEAVFESLQVLPMPKGAKAISTASKKGKMVGKKGVANFYKRKLANIGKTEEALKKQAATDVVSMLQPNGKEFQNVAIDKLPKYLDDTIKTIKPVESIEDMGKHFNYIKTISLDASDSIVKIDPTKKLSPKNILKPLEEEIDKVAKDPQRIKEWKILRNVFDYESELLKKEAIIGKFGQQRKKDLNKILRPYLEKLDLNVEENSHKAALNLLRKGYKAEMDSVYGPSYKKINEIGSSLIKAEADMKRVKYKGFKQIEEGSLKKIVKKILFVRSISNKSPFLGSYIDKLTPDQLTKLYSQRISKSKTKLTKLLEEKKIVTEKAFKANEELIASKILDVVGREQSGNVGIILSSIKSYADKNKGKITENIGNLLDDVAEKLGVKHKFLSDDDYINFAAKESIKPFEGKEKNEVYKLLLELEQLQRLKNPKFKKEIGEELGLDYNNFIDSDDSRIKEEITSRLIELGGMTEEGLYTKKTLNSFSNFKEIFKSLGKGVHLDYLKKK